MPIEVTIKIDDEVLDNLLCSALDPGYGGAYYWCSAKRDPEHPADKAKYLHEVPLRGGSLLITDEEGDKKTYRIDRRHMMIGLDAMSKWKVNEGAHHFSHIVAGNEGGLIDAETGDAFLQACCFGKLIYG